MEAATASVRAEKEASEALSTARQQEVEKLSKQSEDRFRIGLNWKKRADQLAEEKSALQKQSQEDTEVKDKVMQELNAKADGLTAELTSIKEKVEETERKLTEAEEKVRARDATIQGLQAETSTSKSSASTSESSVLVSAESGFVPARKELISLCSLQCKRNVTD